MVWTIKALQSVSLYNKIKAFHIRNKSLSLIGQALYITMPLQYYSLDTVYITISPGVQSRM